MFGKLHNFLKELFKSKMLPFSGIWNSFQFSNWGVLYTELTQNKADIVFAARWSFAVNWQCFCL